MSETATNWPALTPWERRVLGVLVEKQKTARSADAYPLSLNAIVTGSNQKSNRDPVMDLSDDEAEEALDEAMSKGLVTRLQGGRVDRWRHNLYETWSVSKVEMAILAELLLRGPQTEGELRGRASRMDPIDDLDQLRGYLKSLAARKLVVYLLPPERRGTILTHGFHLPEELARLQQQAAHAAVPDDPAEPPRSVVAARSGDAERLTALEARVTEALERIESLNNEVTTLKASVARLQKELGLDATVLPAPPPN